jgi:GAF domain-containing protein
MERAQNRLAILLELTAGLAERMELEAIASFVLGVGLNAIEANRGTLCLLTPDSCFFEVVAHKGYDTEMMDSWRRFALDAPLPASDAVRTRHPIYLHSPAERAARYPIFANTGGDGASAMLPLFIGDEPLGAIVFGFDGERGFDDGDRSFLDALTTQCAIALDRARLYEAALRRQASLALVADASSILAAAGDDLDTAMQRLANLSSPALCDVTRIHLIEPEARSRLVATSLAADATEPQGLEHALRTGDEVAWDDGIIVPMLAHGRVLGACVFANQPQRTMTDEDRQLARTLGERAAVLLDNARLMRSRKEVSTGLQAALLPPLLPTIAGFEIGARYQPAGEGLDVGGDFYDVLPVAAGRTLLVVGDVSGHGVKAAAATGLVRHTIRSAAMMGLSPSRILDHANNAMLNSAGALPSGTYCTIALALLIPGAPDGGPGNAHPRIVMWWPSAADAAPRRWQRRATRLPRQAARLLCRCRSEGAVCRLRTWRRADRVHGWCHRAS